MATAARTVIASATVIAALTGQTTVIGIAIGTATEIATGKIVTATGIVVIVTGGIATQSVSERAGDPAAEALTEAGKRCYQLPRFTYRLALLLRLCRAVPARHASM